MLRIPGDVVVEQHDAEQKELWVVSSEPIRREERLTLDLTPPGQSLTVRVVESKPVMMDGDGSAPAASRNRGLTRLGIAGAADEDGV